MTAGQTATKTAALYRMVTDQHICPYGIKSKYLLQQQGYTVDDHWLTTREETDAFKAKHDVKTTPINFYWRCPHWRQRRPAAAFGKKVKAADAVSYIPVPRFLRWPR